MFRKTLLALLLTASGLVHAQIPVSGLPPATTPLGANDKIIVNQPISGTVYSTRQAPLSALAPFFPSINSHYILQAPDPLLPQSRTLVGTTNQVIISDGGALGNLTLSLPQSICTTCGPTFSSLTLTGVLNGFSGVFSSTLQSAGYTGTTGVFSSTLQAASLSLTTPLQATSGGTGFGTYAVGDLLAASTTTALSKLSDVAAGSYLRSGGVSTLPLWSTLTLPNAATTGDVLIATGTNAIGSLADVSAGSYLRSNGAGAAPVYSTVKIPNTAVLGDIWYGSAANTITVLAGNITTGVQFLAQTGSGAASAAPVWTTLPGSFTGFANPSGLIGMSAVNGAATTATRSDATHAIDPAIAPTWTGIHTFSSINPEIVLNATGAALNQKNWLLQGGAGGGVSLSTATDAAPTSAVSNGITIGRVGTAIASVTLGNNTDNPIVTVGGGQMSITGKNGAGVTCTSSSGTNGTALCVGNNTTGGHTMWSQVISPVGGAGNELGLLIDGGTLSNATDVLFRVDGGNFSQVLTVNGLGATTFNGASVTSNVGIILTGARPTLNSAVSGFYAGATTGGVSQYALVDSAGAVDSKMWDVFTDTTTFNMRADNDANSGASTWLRATRSGLTVTDITTAASAFHMTGIGTTASAANMFIDNASGNNILRSTSSRRYKTDITTLADATDVVMSLRPVRFHSKATADSHTAWFYGLVAEEVATIEPSLIVKDPEGRPDGVQYDRVQVFMLPVVQSMHRQIYWLWACIFLLASWNVYLTLRKK